MNQTYYGVLGLTATATAAQIKAAYKRLAWQFHPDRNGQDPAAAEHFKQINEAYQVLSNPGRRAAYDWLRQYQERLQQQSAYVPPVEPVSYAPAAPPARPFPWRRVWSIGAGWLLLLVAWVGYTGWKQHQVANAYAGARFAEKHQNWPLAEAQFTRVIAYEPEAEEALFRRAHLRQHYLQNPQGAAADLTSLILLAEQPSPNLYAQRAKCWLALRQFPAALRDLNRALAGKPNLTNAYFDRAVAHLQLEDDWSQAVADLTYFLKNAPARHPSTEALLYRAFAYYRLGQLPRAWRDAAQVLHQPTPSTRAQAYYLQAKVKQVQQDTAASCALLEQAAALGLEIAVAEQERGCR